MEILHSRVLVIFVVLLLGVICIGSFNNVRYENHNFTNISTK